MSTDAEFATEEEEGGPRKSFWEHVADLRTALIRSVLALGVALIVCLLLSPQIVELLELPIRRIRLFEPAQPTVSFEIGSNRLGPYVVNRQDFPALPAGKAPQVVYRLGTLQIGDQQVVTLVPDANAKPADTLDVSLYNFSPTEPFMLAFHVAMYAAIVVSSPFWIFFMGSFIVPAFRTREKQVVGQWLFWGAVLAIAGVLLTYFLLLPVALRAALEYSRLLHFNGSNWRADDYIDFACKFMLGMGVGFQFPLVVLLLVKMGLITHRQLAKYRRHVIVVSLILGAILTTPEVITQLAMAIPLYVLYELCVVIAWYWDWKKRRRGEIVEI